jgi:type II secretory pathway component PulF
MIQPPNPPPLPQRPLNYSGPVAPSVGVAPASYAQRVAVFSIIRFIASLAVMLILVVIFLFVVPRLEVVYADFGTKLPWITQLVLDVSRFLRTPLGWVAAAVIAGIVALTTAFLPISGRWLRLLILLVLALVVIGLALAVLLPIVNLMESITSGTGKK